jgi:hypothetical protein
MAWAAKNDIFLSSLKRRNELKIVFVSAQKSSASYIFYSANLARINRLKDGVSLELGNDPLSVDYSAYDVALFMGFDPQAMLAKRQNPSILVGVVEPRAEQKNTFVGVDFIVANSIEARDYFSKYVDKIMVYYDYPQVPEKLACPIEKNKLILGYHGNLIHLEAMVPRITNAISEMAKDIPVELWAMYNIQKLGKWKVPGRSRLGFPVEHIQYSEENYAKYMAHVDIGIVPQFMPVRENWVLRYLIGSANRRFHERSHNFLLRFKETTNIGRHLVFAQYGIPVISDMSPSACAFIEDGVDGYVAYHDHGWFAALKKLALSRSVRIQMGQKLKEKFQSTATPDILNGNLLSFIRTFMNEHESQTNVS